MKKMLSAIIVAVALAAVSTVDAKRMVQRASTPVANLVQAKKEAVMNPTEENKQNLVNTLDEEANTPEKEETVDLAVQKTKIEDGIKIVKDRIKELNYGWFGFGTNKETQQAHRAAQDRLNDLNAQLKEVNAKLAINAKETSKSWVSTVISTITSAKALGIGALVVGAGAVSYDLYYGTGYTQGAISEVRAGMPRTRAAAGRAYTAGKGYAGRAYESGRGAVSGAYNRVRGTAPVGK